MSKPMPKRPQIRIWLTVPGASPTSGSTNGAATRPTAVSTSARKAWRRSISGSRSLAAPHAEQALRAYHQHQDHHREEHDAGVGRVDHRGEAENLAGDDPAEDRAGERADAADHDHHESLDEDRIA